MPPSNGQFGAMSAAGVAVNEDSVLAIETVATCITILVNQVAPTDLWAYKKTTDKSKIRLDVQPPLVTNPWPEGTMIDFLTQVVYSMKLRGNFYGVIAARDFYGVPTVIMPLHPDRVTAIRNSSTGLREYRIDGKIVDPNNILHIPEILPPGQFVGINPIANSRMLFAGSIASTAYGNSYFANSANPSGLLTVAGDLNEEEVMALKQAWNELHQGPGSTGGVGILTGDVKFQPISISPTDSQYLEVRGFTRDAILSLFGIPPHMAGNQDRSPSQTNGIEQLEMAFVRQTLNPLYKRIEQAFSKLLPKSVYVRFDLSDRLRGDTLQRAQAWQIARNGGWLNVDEIRDREDMPPVPDGKGKDYLQPLNMGLLGSDPVKNPNAGAVTDSGVGQDGKGGAVKQ